MVFFIKVILLDIRQNQYTPAMHRFAVLIGQKSRRKVLFLAHIVGDRQRKLLQVSQVAGLIAKLADMLHGMVKPSPSGDNNARRQDS